MSRTILIVDDDTILKTTIRDFLEGGEGDFILSGSVSNGREALDFLEKTPVDIIITDLVMPVMAGLELIRNLKEGNFRGIILVLSNYSDFALVREALLLGAADYLLKTDLNREDLLKRLRDLSRNLNEEADKSLYLEEVDRKFQRNLLRDFLETPAFSCSDFREEARGIDDQFSRGVVLCHLSCRSGTASKVPPMEKLAGMIRTVYESVPDLVLIRTGENRLIWFPPPPKDGRSPGLLLSRIRRQAKIYFSLETLIIHSVPMTDLQEIRTAYGSIREKGTLLFYGEGGMFTSEELVLSSLPPDWSAKDYAIALGQEGERAEERLREEIEWRIDYAARERISPAQLIAFFSSTLEYLGFVEKAKTDTLPFPESREELLLMFEREALRLLSGDKERLFSVKSREIQRVLKYINDNYRSRISLEELALIANLNKSYLCRLFKGETGSSVVDYITDLRINRALALMEEGQTYIKGIAEAVGFEDQFYFARVFKRRTGTSSSEYIKGLYQKNGSP
nr:response regulator [uncultured Sphaerochaeta sp.]